MDFAMLAPEINSGRMYAGPGSGPMLTAAAVWDGLATELYSAASSYQSVIFGLTAGPWLGPSSALMAASAATYAAWLSTTATQAEQTATQAKAAAAAYETAFAATVPPPVVTANRTLLMHLVATNIFGQNTPAISATEIQYTEMWAQDAAAMYGYAGSSASATALTPFTQAPRTTNSGGLADPSASVARAAGTSAVTNTQTALSQLTSTVPATLQGFASPLQPAALTAAVPSLSDLLDGLELTSVTGYAALGVGSADLSATSGAWKAATDADNETALSLDDINDDTNLITDTLRDVHGMEDRIMSRFNQLGAVGPTLSASLGGSASVGALSVPPTWTAAAPAMRLAAVALPTTSLSAAAEAFAGGPGSLFSEMALASMAGRAIGGSVSPGRWGRVAATTRARKAARVTPPASSVTQIAADLRELAELRDSGLLTEEEFAEQKNRVLA
jgi:PPE-repeat protein